MVDVTGGGSSPIHSWNKNDKNNPNDNKEKSDRKAVRSISKRIAMLTTTKWQCIQRLAASPAASSVASTDFPCFIAWSLHPPCLVLVSSRTSTLPTAFVWCRVVRKGGLESTERSKGTLFFSLVCRDVAGMSTVLCDSMECEQYEQILECHNATWWHYVVPNGLFALVTCLFQLLCLIQCCQ